MRTLRIKIDMVIDGSNLGYFLISSVRNFKSNLSQCQTGILNLGTERYTLFTGFMAYQLTLLGLLDNLALIVKNIYLSTMFLSLSGN